jgi:hypothetical protein
MILLVLLLVAIVFALGFVVKGLVWVALGFLALWGLGWLARRPGCSWYLW